MDFWYLQLAAILVFVERIGGLPLACSYNGTSYGEGETVGTEDPCLFCVCRSGSLECSLRVCADHPNALPLGCFFLHKPNECCPQLFCEDESFSPVGIELRTDYKLENKLNRNDCGINGSVFAEGSAVGSRRVCEYCYCVEGEIKCLKPRCLQSFEGCKAIFERSSCCPTHYDCRDADMNLLGIQIEKFVLADVDANSSNESLRTFSDSVPNFDESKPVKNTTGKAAEEFGETTTTAEANAEGTTATTEEEATTPTDVTTSFGFQTTESESDEPTETESTEGTSSPPEESTIEEGNLEASGVQMRGKSNFSEPLDSPETPPNDGRNDSSLAAEDYDSYDYGEPQLPPSLPNLVIFPFVAADAVVKDDAAAVPEVEIKRIDSHPEFYKDYFSPPAKTEGGFVPKETFYERDYFKEDQIESPDAEQKTEELCQTLPCKPDDRWTSVTGDLKTAKPGLLEEIVEPPTDFRDESATFQKSQQTKKPVTVTYKHVVVDFYPKYLITTTRARPKIEPNSRVEVRPVGGFGDSAQNIQNVIAVTNAASETAFGFVQEIISPTPPKKTRETPSEEQASTIAETTVESSFFDEFLNSFFSEEITTKSAKQKYSSKIKGNTKPMRDGFEQKTTTEGMSSTNSYPHSSGSKTSPEVSADRKGATGQKFGPPRRNENLLTESAKRGTASSSGESDVGVGGGILKLAGCNIYGMMYRVGKVITELSGPCLECLCTESGVQCRQLKC